MTIFFLSARTVQTHMISCFTFCELKNYTSWPAQSAAVFQSRASTSDIRRLLFLGIAAAFTLTACLRHTTELQTDRCSLSRSQ